MVESSVDHESVCVMVVVVVVLPALDVRWRGMCARWTTAAGVMPREGAGGDWVDVRGRGRFRRLGVMVLMCSRVLGREWQPCLVRAAPQTLSPASYMKPPSGSLQETLWARAGRRHSDVRIFSSILRPFCWPVVGGRGGRRSGWLFGSTGE